MPERMPPSSSPLRSACLGSALALLATVSGASEARAGALADWIAGKVAPTPMNAPDAEGNPDRSLISRWLSSDRSLFTASGSKGDTSVYAGQLALERARAATDPVVKAEYDAAKRLFDAGDFAGAERLLKPLAKREVKKGSTVGQDAQFLLAESQFKQQRYVAAEESYEYLVKKYQLLPTRMNDEIVNREYAIARAWLALEDPKARPLGWKSHFDGRQPLLDTGGYAVKALEHVRQHDPNGPLADDATLMTADHYHIRKDYEAAALYYDQLTTEYPKSEFKQRAQLSSIDAKLKGYIGPEYDITGLEQARKTIQDTMAEFPEDLTVVDGLRHTEDLIKDQEAERAYSQGMYYVRARKPISAEYQFGLVMARWPQSKWATQAKQQMAVVAKMPRKASVPSKIMTLPGSNDPNQMGQGGMNGMQNMMGGMMGGGGMGGMGGGMGGMGGPG